MSSSEHLLIGTHVASLPTPCLLVDEDLLLGNVKAMSDLLRQHGKSIRPHVKTHKCSRLARLQLEHGASGVCVAKLSEAEALMRHGVRDILITGPVVGRQAHLRLVACLRENPELLVTFDDAENARTLAAEAALYDLSISCLIDVDLGLCRTGVQPRDAIRLAEEISAIPNVAIKGMQAYAGHAQHIASLSEREDVIRKGLAEACAAFKECQARVEGMRVLSVGGTGSVQFDMAVPEVTEVQAGSYLFMDAEYLVLEWGNFLKGPGTFAASLSLLSTVVSTNQPDFVTIDAGLKSMYRDGAVPFVASPVGAGLSYDWFGDEYGKILIAPDGARPKLGGKIALTVSHCDPTINLHDFLYIVKDGVVVDIWPVDLRGCSQ